MKWGWWKGLLFFLIRYVGIFLLHSDPKVFQPPITWMPFGKRLLTSAVEGEFKQSCVIFSFYFMSSAATIHDGCGSLVHFL